MASDYPYGRNKLDKRPDPPPPRAEPDELDRTARQVRLDYEGGTVHELASSWSNPWSGVVYLTRCDEALSNRVGAILTTREATCEACRG